MIAEHIEGDFTAEGFAVVEWRDAKRRRRRSVMPERLARKFAGIVQGVVRPFAYPKA